VLDFGTPETFFYKNILEIFLKLSNIKRFETSSSVFKALEDFFILLNGKILSAFYDKNDKFLGKSKEDCLSVFKI